MVKRITLSTLVTIGDQAKTLEKNIGANVVFGQTSRGCKGNGICRVDMLRPKNILQTAIIENKDEEEDLCRWYEGVFYLTNQGQIALRIERNKLGEIAYKRYFEDTFFELAEDFQLPQWLCTALEKPSYKILTGYYWIERTPQYLEVIF